MWGDITIENLWSVYITYSYVLACKNYSCGMIFTTMCGPISFSDFSEPNVVGKLQSIVFEVSVGPVMHKSSFGLI